jgi:hypothetical protein
MGKRSNGSVLPRRLFIVLSILSGIIAALRPRKVQSQSSSLNKSLTIRSRGKEEPERFRRMAAGEMEADTIQPLPDPAADLDRSEAQGVQLHGRDPLFDQPASDRVKEPVGRGIQRE